MTSKLSFVVILLRMMDFIGFASIYCIYWKHVKCLDFVITCSIVFDLHIAVSLSHKYCGYLLYCISLAYDFYIYDFFI